MADSTTVALGEQRLHRRILVVLGLLGLLVALAFSQRGAMFTPPVAFAAATQNVPEALSVLPGDPVNTFGGGIIPRGGRLARETPPGAIAPGATLPVGTAPGVAPATESEGMGGPADTPAQSSLPTITPSFAEPVGARQASGPPTIQGPEGSTPGGIAPPATPNPTTPVPEPATWLILMVGIGIIGGALRRRRVPVIATTVTAFSAA